MMNTAFELIVALGPIVIKWNLFLMMAAAATFALAPLKISHSSRQLILRGALIAALLPPLVSAIAARVFEPTNVFGPSIQIAAGSTSADSGAPSTQNFAFVATKSPNLAKLESETKTIVWIGFALLVFTLLSVIVRSVRILIDRRKIRVLSSRAFRLRRLGHVDIFVSDNVSVPFATRFQNRSLVFVPQTLLTDAKSMNLAIRHELQHHRQRDLQWNVGLETARLVAGWNPLVRQWLERIEETDELACDENLLGRGRIDVMDYATCLYRVAVINQTTGGGARLVGTAGMATSPKFLKRRIEMTLHRKIESSRTFAKIALVSGLVFSTGLAWASESLVRDRRITTAQAERLALKVAPGIPVVINRRVLSILNDVVGNPRTRFYMRNTLKRMQVYKPMISARLRAAGLPEELLVIPAVEGGYQNIESPTSAGLWQFVPETARRFGLTVDDSRDDRLDAAKETDAAIAYLSKNLALYSGDWHLTLLSYNQGESQVSSIIAKTGVRDVFKMADKGILKSKEGANYVPKMMAALIILANPDLVNE